MAEFLLVAAAFVMAMVALGLVRILRGPRDADRIMAAQLFGTGGIAALLLLAEATSEPAAVDVALSIEQAIGKLLTQAAIELYQKMQKKNDNLE